MGINEQLIKCAWQARENAFPWKSGTRVGCAILTSKQNIILGWNIEGLWQTSIHAEVSAIAKMIPGDKVVQIAIASECKFFMPCGACYDWLIQFADEDCEIFIQNKDRQIYEFNLRELYPHYPIQ